LTTIAAEE